MKKLTHVHAVYDRKHNPIGTEQLPVRLLQPGSECYPPGVFSDHHIESSDPSVSFGAALRRVREYLELTQSDLGRRINESRQLASHWELGTATPDPMRRAEIADALGIPRGVLVHGDPLPADDNQEGAVAAT